LIPSTHGEPVSTLSLQHASVSQNRAIALMRQLNKLVQVRDEIIWQAEPQKKISSDKSSSTTVSTLEVADEPDQSLERVHGSGRTIGSIMNFTTQLPVQLKGTHRNKIPFHFLLTITNPKNHSLLASFNFSKITPDTAKMFKVDLSLKAASAEGMIHR
jgi:hypothetical protein